MRVFAVINDDRNVRFTIYWLDTHAQRLKPNKKQRSHSSRFHKETVSYKVEFPYSTVHGVMQTALSELSLSLWNELGEHENWADLQQYIMYEGAWRLLLNSVQVASEGAAKWKCWRGHLKPTICGNLSTWKRHTRLQLYSSTAKPRFYSDR